MPTCPTATSDCDGAVFSANAFRIPTDEVLRRDAIAGDLEDRRQAKTARPDHLKPSTPTVSAVQRSSGSHTTPNPKFGSSDKFQKIENFAIAHLWKALK